MKNDVSSCVSICFILSGFDQSRVLVGNLYKLPFRLAAALSAFVKDRVDQHRIAFKKIFDDDHLAVLALVLCQFEPMQGVPDQCLQPGHTFVAELLVELGES